MKTEQTTQASSLASLLRIPLPPYQSGIVPQVLCIMGALVIFGLFMAFQGKNPFAILADMWIGSFGSPFAFQNTLVRAAPLLLTALCTLIPAHLGLVIIGNEGAWLMGGLSAAGAALAFVGLPPIIAVPLILLCGTIGGGIWIALSGLARQFRSVDPTISSLLLYYVAWGIFLFLVEGPLRDPLSLNKPSTKPVSEVFQIASIPGTSVHWGLIIGVLVCIGIWFLLFRTRAGFAARIAGGNERVAASIGLPRSVLVIAACFLAGACAGLAGGIEVLAVQRSASASLNAGIGMAGILVAFLARQNPFAIIPVALLLGGLQASGGFIQRHHGIPDATIGVFQGLIFLAVLVSETFRNNAEQRRKA